MTTPLHVRKTLTIFRPRMDVYRFWREFENFPRFMRHLENVVMMDEQRSRWRASGPFGDVTWYAIMTEDVPGERIAWRSEPGGDVDNMGAVTFADAPGGRGTEVRVDIVYDAPGGKLGQVIAKAFGEEPEGQIKDDLRRFKSLMETGDILQIEGQPSSLLRGEKPEDAQHGKAGLR